jgi:hypothetical protein
MSISVKTNLPVYLILSGTIKANCDGNSSSSNISEEQTTLVHGLNVAREQQYRPFWQTLWSPIATLMAQMLLFRCERDCVVSINWNKELGVALRFGMQSNVELLLGTKSRQFLQPIPKSKHCDAKLNKQANYAQNAHDFVVVCKEPTIAPPAR